MSIRLAFVFLASVWLCCANVAFACSPSTPDVKLLSLLSFFPAKQPPKGAVQLSVKVSHTEEFNRAEFESGEINFKIINVRNGKFSGNSVNVKVDQGLGCGRSLESYSLIESFTDTYESNITILPLNYYDSSPILDEGGKQEYGMLFYIDNVDIFDVLNDEEIDLWQKQGKSKINKSIFVEYSSIDNYNFINYEPLMCLYNRRNEEDVVTESVWRKCVKPGEYIGLACTNKGTGALVCEQDDWMFKNRPPDLQRGYIPWGGYGAVLAIFLALLIALYEFIAFKRKYS